DRGCHPTLWRGACMTTSHVPKNVQVFLRNKIGTPEELDILLRLRTAPSRPWKADSLATTLHIPSSTAEEALVALSERDLVEAQVAEEEQLFTYHPKTRRLDKSIGALARINDENRLEICTSWPPMQSTVYVPPPFGRLRIAFSWKRKWVAEERWTKPSSVSSFESLAVALGTSEQ